MQKGDILKGSHDLIIPGYNDPEVQKMYQEAITYIGQATGKAKVGGILEYVRKALRYDLNWNESMHGRTVNLSDALKARVGVCKEMAAATDMILSMEGIKSEYKRGKFLGGRHAWLKVKVDGEEKLADPTNLLFGDYDSVSSYNGFVEGPNPIIRS